MGIELKAGDEVLTTTQDYPSVLPAWRQRAARDGVVLKEISFPTPPPNPEDLLDRFARALTARTRVIAFCQVTYTTGQVFPVREICRMARAEGIQTIVDGAHAFAQFPFQAADLECDYFGTSLHKWMMAPAALRENIRKFEATGVSPFAIRSAITGAVDFHESVGADRKAARLRYLRQYWMRRVAGLPGVKLLNVDDPRMSCGLGAMTLTGWDSTALTAYLMREHRIHVRAREVMGEFHCVRVTPNIYSTIEELETFCAAIETASRNRMPNRN